MGVVIMTSHWEEITYSQSAVESVLSSENPENKTSVRPLYEGRVIVISKENDDEDNELLVKMHAGLWATCYDLTGKLRHVELYIFWSRILKKMWFSLL